jgi:hypothetical protein
MQLYLLYFTNKSRPLYPLKATLLLTKQALPVMKRRQFYSLLVYLEYSLSAPVRRTFMMKVNNPKKKFK